MSTSLPNTSYRISSRRRAARVALAIAIAAALTLAGAWFFQLALDIRPCPLCLEQRTAYYVIVPLALLVAAARKRPRALIVAGFAIIAIAALWNAGLGAYHAGIEWKWWPGPAECSGAVAELGKAGDLLQRLDSEKVVRCDEVQWRFFGLSLAGYNVLISLGLAALAAYGASIVARPRP